MIKPNAWIVVVGGSQAARQRWPARIYKLRSSARRRMRQIRLAHDTGVSTVWLVAE